MEAIAEMLAAILMGLVQIIVLPVQIALEFLAVGIEFLFTSLWKGREAAEDKLQQRRADQAKRRNASVSDSPAPRAPTPEERRAVVMRAGVVVIGLLVLIGYWWVSSKIRQQRIATTKIQISQLADNFIQQAMQPKANLPEGVLLDRDAFGLPCELFVDQWMVGTLIVVRSAGADRQTGTLDDMLAVRFARPQLKVLGMKLEAVGLKAIQGRLAKLVPAKQGNPLPQQINIQMR